MFARTLYNITRTQVSAGAAKALAALAVLLFISCSSNSTVEEIEEINQSTDPLNFTCLTEGNETEHASRAAGSSPLTSDFMVSTFKAYNLTSQYTVMDKYHVEYKTSGTAWDGTVRPYWDYTKVSGQYEKFWDYSAFPYRFHAVAPYPANPGSITLGDESLSINATYRMQSVLNGMVTPASNVAEPFLAAQLQRNADGRDWDHLATTHPKEINTGSSTRNRYVSLPFHHLNSKVRFGIYCTTPWTTANPLYIEELTVKVASSNFVTAANGYVLDAPGVENNSWYRGTGNSGFTNPTFFISSDDEKEKKLLHFDGGKEISDNDLSHHQGRSSAYWLQCQDGIMQIPQEDVILYVSLKLRRIDDDSIVKEFTNVPIRMDDGTYKYNWLSGYIHTYYLIIGDIEDHLEITFTATLTPWEDVTGSLSTDLEQ